MTAKKKTPKKPKRTARQRSTAKNAQKRPKVAAKKKPAPKRAEKKKVAAAKQPRKKSKPMEEESFPLEHRAPLSGEQSGDLQGLSRREGADSESVDELLEEGNAFEAGVVAGVESAGEAEGQEVHTHEVPEDDVPGEYSDTE